MNRRIANKVLIPLAVILGVALQACNITGETAGDALVGHWDFTRVSPSVLKSLKGGHELSACPGKNAADMLKSGCLYLDGKSYLYIPYKDTGTLNVHNNKVSVLAWVKKDSGSKIGFVAGMWNEYEDGGKRQYGLFVSLPAYNGADQVCGHISKNGGPTPPFKYSIDYSASAQKVPFDRWTFIAFTYDGKYIRSYVNGEFKARAPELINYTKCTKYPNGLVHSKNPYYFPDGIGDNGSDFTVGAVRLKKGMGNFFKGSISEIRVYDCALTDDQIRDLYNKSKQRFSKLR